MKLLAFRTIWIAVLSALLCAHPVHAAPMFHYDVASLYYMADLVVEETEGDPVTINYSDVYLDTVTKVYKGKAEVGQKIKVSYSAYSRAERSFGNTIQIVQQADGKWVSVTIPAPPLKFKKALLFLNWHERYNSYLPAGDGARLIATDGTVYSFMQMSNPGPYGLVVATPDYLILKRGQTFNEDGLFEELALAIKHVQTFEDVLKKSDPEELKKFMHAPWGKEEFFKRYEFSMVAAQRLSEMPNPATSFAMLLHPKQSGVNYETENTFLRGLCNKAGLEYLLGLLENEKTPADELALAAKLVPQVGLPTVRTLFKTTEEFVADQLRQRKPYVIRAMLLLQKTTQPAAKIAAAELLFNWHPAKFNDYAHKPLPLTDTILCVLKDVRDQEMDPKTKAVLTRWYCRLGGVPAYQQSFGNDLGLLVYAPDETTGYPPDFHFDVLDRAFWDKPQEHPIIEATALDGPEKGKVYTGENVEKDAAKNYSRYRNDEHMQFTNAYVNARFNYALKPGLYSFRIVWKLKINGEVVDWYSDPVEATIAPQKPNVLVLPGK